jgi:metallo-beta-lactamase class B
MTPTLDYSSIPNPPIASNSNAEHVTRSSTLIALSLALSSGTTARAQTGDSAAARLTTPNCPNCATWNAPQRPFRVFGDTYYVGTHGLASVLVTSPAGHVLIDGGLPESAPEIIAHIRALGFRVEDVKLLLNSHVHFDHAGGLAELQRVSGASVAATAPSAEVLKRGTSGPDDPQYGILTPIAPVRNVRVVADGETVHVGPLALTAHLTAGHTPGGTTWTWRSCEGERCEDLVYADSQTPVSADNFFFTRSTTYPNALADFAKGLALLETVPCGILLTPHPDASELWTRLGRRDAGDATALVDSSACRRFAATARERLAQRVAKEKSTP